MPSGGPSSPSADKQNEGPGSISFPGPLFIFKKSPLSIVRYQLNEKVHPGASSGVVFINIIKVLEINGKTFIFLDNKC